MLAVFRKDFKLYVSGLYGWLIFAVQLLFMGLFVALYNLLYGVADFSYPLKAMQWVLILVSPFLCMRAFAEERHARTDLWLATLPLSAASVVLGKFLAAFALFMIPTAVAAIYPLLLASFGEIALTSAYVAWFGYVLMGLSLISLCLYVSSLAQNRMVAALLSVASVLAVAFLSGFATLIPSTPLVSFVLLLVVCLCGAALMWHACHSLAFGVITVLVTVLPLCVLYILKPSLFSGLVSSLLLAVSPIERFFGFTYGHFDLVATLFYLSFIGFFCYLTVRSVKTRRS